MSPLVLPDGEEDIYLGQSVSQWESLTYRDEEASWAWPLVARSLLLVLHA